MSKKSSNPTTHSNGIPKLQKFLADAGICSRRAAEGLIKEGQVSVNGETAILGSRVNPERDVVKVGNKRIQSKFVKPVVYIVNKPKGFTCSNDDPHAERLIFELLETRHRSLRLFCAGRLDVDSEGLVILTNDGNLAHRLTHPSQQVRKNIRLRSTNRWKKMHLGVCSTVLMMRESFYNWMRFDPNRETQLVLPNWKSTWDMVKNAKSDAASTVSDTG